MALLPGVNAPGGGPEGTPSGGRRASVIRPHSALRAREKTAGVVRAVGGPQMWPSPTNN